MKESINENDIEQSLRKIMHRLETNPLNKHFNINIEDVRDLLIKNKSYLNSLHMMEITGGEPNILEVLESDDGVKQIIFIDSSTETPKGRVSLCYDKLARESRKKFKPKSSVQEIAIEMGVEIADESYYKKLQSLKPVDTKTSSWLKTPENIRKLGGAIFGDRRYDTVFIYHNGADSYYSSRGFRGVLKI